MEYSKLLKQDKLLLVIDAFRNANKAFTVESAIKNGYLYDRKQLSSLLGALSKKNLLVFKGKHDGWQFTKLGIETIDFLHNNVKDYDENKAKYEIQFKKMPSMNEAMKEAFASMAASFEALSKNLKILSTYF